MRRMIKRPRPCVPSPGQAIPHPSIRSMSFRLVSPKGVVHRQVPTAATPVSVRYGTGNGKFPSFKAADVRIQINDDLVSSEMSPMPENRALAPCPWADPKPRKLARRDLASVSASRSGRMFLRVAPCGRGVRWRTFAPV